MWQEAESFLQKDKYLGPLVKKWGPCAIKVSKHDDYFEDICSNIVGQQLSGKAADTIFSRFKTAVGGKVTPDSVLKTDGQIIRDAGMSWGKVSFVKDLAEKTKTGKLQTKKLNDMADDDVIREMVAVKGIGLWTAQMFLMFSLGRPDVFPADDLGIKKGFEKITGKATSNKEMLEFSDRWRPHRTVASWYIWRSLD